MKWNEVLCCGQHQCHTTTFIGQIVSCVTPCFNNYVEWFNFIFGTTQFELYLLVCFLFRHEAVNTTTMTITIRPPTVTTWKKWNNNKRSDCKTDNDILLHYYNDLRTSGLQNVCMYVTCQFIKRRTRQVASRPLNRTTKKCRPMALVK